MTTDPPATTDAPAATDPPATTDAPAATDPPATTEAPAAPNPPPPTGQPAADGSSLAPGQASFALPDGVVTLDVVSTCRVTVFTAFNVSSYLFDAGFPTGPLVLEIQTDEGAPPFVVVSALRGEIQGFNGQDFSAGSYWGASFDGTFGEPVDQLTLNPLPEGFAESDINVSFNLDPTQNGECATGLRGSPWPFAGGETPQVLDRFDERFTEGASEFGVLAACGQDGPLLLTEGQILSHFELDGELRTTFQTSAQFGSPTVLARGDDLPGDVLIDQQGGGGDVTYVTPVSAFDGTDDSYLSWTERPRGVTGGLPVVDC